MMPYKSMVWTDVSREMGDRLSRMCEKEFVHVCSIETVRMWYDPITKTLYRESTCNGPSSWASSEL